MRSALTPEQQAACDAYHAATNHAEERIAYQRMRAAGLPPSYGESDEPAADGNPWPFIEWMTTWPGRIGEQQFDRDGNLWLLDGGTLRCVEQKTRRSFDPDNHDAIVDIVRSRILEPMIDRIELNKEDDLLVITRDVARGGGA